MPTRIENYQHWAEYWLRQVEVIYHIIEDEYGNRKEEYYCPFCHNTSTKKSYLYHDDGCPLTGE